jgi:hypothetical protein
VPSAAVEATSHSLILAFRLPRLVRVSHCESQLLLELCPAYTELIRKTLDGISRPDRGLQMQPFHLPAMPRPGKAYFVCPPGSSHTQRDPKAPESLLGRAVDSSRPPSRWSPSRPRTSGFSTYFRTTFQGTRQLNALAFVRADEPNDESDIQEWSAPRKPGQRDHIFGSIAGGIGNGLRAKGLNVAALEVPHPH